jgi:protein tyrosine phosphatase
MNFYSLKLFFLQKLTLLPAENVSHRDAHLPDNIYKNRHTQIIPCKTYIDRYKIFFLLIDDHNRVCLSRILGHPYINASFIQVKLQIVF